VFEGYASLFRIPDLGRDVVLPGAFAESVARRGAAGIRMLWQHDPAEPIGRWLAIREDGRGLLVRGRLNPGVGRAREIAALIRDGGVDGLSIGFRTAGARRDRASGLRHVSRIDLWEISLVTFPLHPGARVHRAPPLPEAPCAAGPRRILQSAREPVPRASRLACGEHLSMRSVRRGNGRSVHRFPQPMRPR
jgi:HK97 family phage prohead protease